MLAHLSNRTYSQANFASNHLILIEYEMLNTHNTLHLVSIKYEWYLAFYLVFRGVVPFKSNIQTHLPKVYTNQ